jgi:hypothetical protein
MHAITLLLIFSRVTTTFGNSLALERMFLCKFSFSKASMAEDENYGKEENIYCAKS